MLYQGLPWAMLALVLPPLIVLAAGKNINTGGPVSGDRVVGIIGAEKYTLADVDGAVRGKLSQEILWDYARQSEIADLEGFNRCVQSGQGKKAVAADIAEGKNFGVKSTPSFFINGRFFSGMPKDIDAVIQEEIDNRK